MLTSREAKELRGLQQRRGRDRTGRFMAEGVRVVEDLLASNLEVRWLATMSSLEDSDRGRALIRQAERRGIPRRVLPDRAFDDFAATDAPQGVIAVADIPVFGLDDLDERAVLPAVVVVLDALQDPGNVGTIIRSAEAFAAAGVVALPGTADPWSPKAIRAAAGSTFRMPIVFAGWADASSALRDRGYRIVGTAAEGDPIIPSDRVALILGNEGAGLSPEVRRDVDELVGIRIRGRAESLNVAAAAAILLYELTTGGR